MIGAACCYVYYVSVNPRRFSALLMQRITSLTAASHHVDPTQVFDSSFCLSCSLERGEKQYKQMRVLLQTQTGSLSVSMENLAKLAKAQNIKNMKRREMSNVTANSPVTYHHLVWYKLVRSCDNQTVTMVLTVTEKDNKRLSKGGSAFYTLIEGSLTRATCPYNDHFNGTYTICCTVRENLSRISIELQLVNFSMFINDNLMMKILFNMTMRVNGRFPCQRSILLHDESIKHKQHQGTTLYKGPSLNFWMLILIGIHKWETIRKL